MAKLINYQNGKNFDAHGNEVCSEDNQAPKKSRIKQTKPVDKDIDSDEDIDCSDWRALKKRLEDAGGVWSNSKNAVAYLENL